MKTISQMTKEELEAIKQQRGLVELEDISTMKVQDWNTLKKILTKERNNWLENSDNKHTLTEIAVARFINNHCHVITLPNGSVSVYDPEKGFYHKSSRYIYRVIHVLEPTFTETKAKNVLFMLSSIDRKYETDGILSDFEPQYRDVKRFLLVKNGIFDKHQKKLLPFDHRFINFSTIETNYIDEPESPVIDGWNVDDWLLDLMSGDEELVELLWQGISASLNGNYSYRQSLWLIGKGNDGKGTYQQLITNLVGMRNVASLKLNQFAERFALAGIEGKTVIIGDDVQAGIYIDDSSNFNSIVTGESVLVEEKGKPAYSTVFKKTVIQSTNAMPIFKNKTNGTNRRFIFIPFKKTFNATDDNWAIKDDYINRQDVLEYVLWKAIRMDFQRFSQPPAVVEMLDEFKLENNTVLQFMQDFFPVESERLPVKFVWANYQHWCRDNNVMPMKKLAFVKAFEELAVDYEKKIAKTKNFFRPRADALDGLIFTWTDKDIEKAYLSFCSKN